MIRMKTHIKQLENNQHNKHVNDTINDKQHEQLKKQQHACNAQQQTHNYNNDKQT